MHFNPLPIQLVQSSLSLLIFSKLSSLPRLCLDEVAAALRADSDASGVMVVYHPVASVSSQIDNVLDQGWESSLSIRQNMSYQRIDRDRGLPGTKIFLYTDHLTSLSLLILSSTNSSRSSLLEMNIHGGSHGLPSCNADPLLMRGPLSSFPCKQLLSFIAAPHLTIWRQSEKLAMFMEGRSQIIPSLSHTT